MRWMIYGANGYTGELIARQACKQDLPKPILADRSAGKLQPLSEELGCELRVFGLDSIQQIAQQLKDVDLVLHCAGPFSATAAPMIEACLQAKAHYLDITGEIAVFEHAHAQHDRAQKAGVVICPGVGFDVIPTDCVAAALKQALPDATHLCLGYDSKMELSPGTTKTTLEGIALGGRVRENGEIRAVPLADRTRRIDMGDGEKLCMAIAWGDVSTAYHSTGIPNVEVYIPGTEESIKQVQGLNKLRWLLKIRWVNRLLQSLAARKVKGPDATQRANNPNHVWGEVRNAKGETRVARIKVANGYDVTVSGALHIVEALLAKAPAGGTYTPSKLLGADLVSKLPGSGPLTLE